jgi:hypothetical protein
MAKQGTQTAVNAGISDLRSHILNRADLPEEVVPVDGWGISLLVIGMTGKQRANFQKTALKQTPGAKTASEIDWQRFWADLVISCAYDPNTREKVFETADRDMLLEKAAANLEVVSAKARELSGLNEAALPKSESATSDD